METIIKIADLLILGLIISTPILLLLILQKLNTKRTFLIYLLIGVIVLGILIFTFSWWCDKSNMMLLRNYGYNIDGINDIEIYRKVSPNDLEQIKRLETSIMGIGWQLKALFGYVFVIPYLLIIYLGKMLITRLANKRMKI